MNNEETETPKPKKSEHLKQRKVFDVMAPGKAPAASNSRGVIVGHKSKVKEDMFVGSKAHDSMAGDPDEKRELMTSSDKVSINPVSKDLEASAPPVTKKTLAAPIGAAAIPAEPEEVIAPEPEQPKPTLTPPEEVTSAPLLGDNAVKSEAPAPAEETAPAAEELTPEQKATNQAMENPPTVETPQEILNEAAKDEDGHTMSGEDLLAGTHAPNLDQAIISHHKHKTKWWEWLLIFFLIVLIALVALNFLLDAEVLTTELGVPHTNIIKD